MVEEATCNECGEPIRPVVTSVRRSGPTRGKQYSPGKSASTTVSIEIACGCQSYSSRPTEEFGTVSFNGHLPDAWATDDKELDDGEHSK